MAVSHVTIPGGTVVSTTFDKLYGEVGILHEDGNDAVAVRVDGVNPVIAGDGSYTILPGDRRILQLRHASDATSVVVKATSATTAQIELEVPDDTP